MSFLIIDDKAKAAAARVVDYAATHRYTIGAGWVPGDDPNFVVELSSYRCVFTFTVPSTGGLYRHLSVSVIGGGEDTYPMPLAVWEIATLFGFTGWEIGKDTPPDWQFIVQKEHRCVVLIQEIK